MVAFALGAVAGLRTMTAPAALWLARGSSPVAAALAAMALAEYAGDLHPKAPARTAPLPLAARIVSGAVCGRELAKTSGSGTLAGTASGAAGAIAGAFIGLALRERAAKRIGAVPAAIIEDLVAIAGAAALLRR